MNTTMKKQSIRMTTGIIASVLAVFVLLTCWVFFAPNAQAEDITNIERGTYYVSLTYSDDGKGTNKSATLTYMTQAGETKTKTLTTGANKFALDGYPTALRLAAEGSSTTAFGSPGKADLSIKDLKVGTTGYGTGTVTNLLTKWNITVGTVGGGTGDFTLDLATGNVSNAKKNGSNEGFTGRNWPYTKDGDYESPYHNGIKTITTSTNGLSSAKTVDLTAWGASDTSATVAASYDVTSVAYDYFGVRVAAQPEYSYTATNSSDGVGWTETSRTSSLSSATFSVTKGAHIATPDVNTNKVTPTVTYTYPADSHSKTTKFSTITINDESYTYNFYAANGKTKHQTGTAKFGDLVAPPTGVQTRAYDRMYHYTYKGWSKSVVKSGVNTNDAEKAYDTSGKFQVLGPLDMQQSFTATKHKVTADENGGAETQALACLQDKMRSKYCSDCAWVAAPTDENNENSALSGNNDATGKNKGKYNYIVEEAPGHTLTAPENVADYKEATCETDGNHGYWYCSKCGHYFVYTTSEDAAKFRADNYALTKANAVAAGAWGKLGHNFEFQNWTWTAVSGGYTAVASFKCVNEYCNVSGGRTTTVNGTVTQTQVAAPTCTAADDNIYQAADVNTTYSNKSEPLICSGEEKIDEVPALGHDFSPAAGNSNVVVNSDGTEKTVTAGKADLTSATHSFKCVRYDACGAIGVVENGEQKVDGNQKHTGGTANCETQKVCTVCAQAYDPYLPHQYNGAVHTTDTYNSGLEIDKTRLGDADYRTGYGGHNYACTAGCSALNSEHYGIMVNGQPTPNGTEQHNFTPEVAKAATCTVRGDTRFTCGDCGFAHTQTDIAVLGHSYGTVSYDWSTNALGQYNRVTATVTCTRATCDEGLDANRHGKQVTETVTPVRDYQKEDCETDGHDNYTATFTDSLLGEDTKEKVLTKTGHQWKVYESGKTVQYTWARDNSAVTAVCECLNNSDHKITARVDTTYTELSYATCTTDGTARYSVDFSAVNSNPTYTNQPTFAEAPKEARLAAYGHDYGAPVYSEWTLGEDGKTYTVSACRTCANDIKGDGVIDHEVKETATAVYAIITDETCETAGLGRYTATFQNDNEYANFATQTKDEVRAALGHKWDFENITRKWTPTGEDDYFDSAQVLCLNDGTHILSERVLAVKKVVKEPTCTEAGTTTYTATFVETPKFNEYKADNTTITHTEDVTLKTIHPAALGHLWGSPTVTWIDESGTAIPSGNYVTIPASAHSAIVCQRDSAHTDETDASISSTKVKQVKTCEQDGITTYRARFGAKYGGLQTTEVRDVTTGHAYTLHTGKRNTCVSPGFDSYYSCDNCSKLFVDETVDGVTSKKEVKNVVKYPDPDSHVDETGNAVAHSILEEKDPTCSTVGNKKVEYCPQCYLIFKIDEEDVSAQNLYFETDEAKAKYEIAIVPENHIYGEQIAKVSATCEDTGFEAHYFCSECGKYFTAKSNDAEVSYESLVIDALKHDYDYATATFELSADKKTVTATAICKNDSTHKDTETVDAVKHVVTERSCTEDGKAYYTATFSKGFNDYQSDDEVDPKTGHNYDFTKKKVKYEWNETYTECTATVTCKNDQTHKHVYTTTNISKVEQGSDNCAVEGKITYTATFAADAYGVPPVKTEDVPIPTTNHTFDYANAEYVWSNDNNRCYATAICTKCGQKDQETADATYVLIKAATCTEDGSAQYVAKFKDTYTGEDGKEQLKFKEQQKPVTLKKTGHDLETIKSKPATCTEEGVRAHYYCKNCKKNFSDLSAEHELKSVVLAKTPHAGIPHGAIAADCVNSGKKAYWSCKVCLKLFSDEACTVETNEAALIVAALGHDLIDREGQDPTCTKAGHSDYQYCLRCKKDFGYVELPKTGHSETYDYDVLKSAESSDSSVRWDIYTCKNGCGDFYAKLSVTIRDQNGKPIPGASVVITDNSTGKTSASGTTDNYGEFETDHQFKEGTYKIAVNYDQNGQSFYATSTISLYNDAKGNINVTEPKIGKADFALDSGNGSSGGNSGNNDDGNSSGNNENLCKYCGKPHTGAFGWLVSLIHSFLAIFSKR